MGRFAKIAVILIVLAGIGTGAYLKFAAVPSNAASNLTTATVQRGSLSATVIGAGNITPAQQVDLNFGQSGTVQAVKVNAGDQVKSGQVLAQLDTSALNLAVQNAQSNLQIAQDKLAQAKNPNTEQDIANARAALASAQASYDKLATPPTATDVASAKAQVTSAQAAYDAAVASAGTTNSQLAAAAAAVQKAQAALQAAQSAYDQVKDRPNIAMLPQSVTLQQDTIDYQSAMANYQSLQATSASSANQQVQQAKSALDQAQANLQKVENPVTKDDLTTAQAQVTEAQNNLEKLLAGSDANTLDIAQNGVDQAQIALKQAQLQLQQAQIVAPFDGVVTAVNITPGQDASAASQTGAIQIADLNHLQVVVDMSEVDVTRVQQGQPAQITLDALPNAALDGKVTQIAPAGLTTQGVVNYPVTVSLTNPPASVKTGMTANVNVIVAQRNNVLVVPNRAVRTQGQQKVVTVLFQGQQIQVPVQTGLSSDTQTEITSGLKEGDTVVLSGTTTATTPARGGFGRGGLGAFGR